MLQTMVIAAILAGLAVMAIGAAIMLVRSERARRIADRMNGGVTSISETDRKKMFVHTLDRMAGMVSKVRTSRTLKEDLAAAGFYAPGAAAAFIAIKLLLVASAVMLVSMSAMITHMQIRLMFALMMVVGGILFFLPNIIVDMKKRARRAEVRRHLPDAIDLLEISLSAGMGLDQAWNAVTKELSSVSLTLADEMELTNLEMHLGSARAVAMRHLADRTGVDELGSLVGVMVQSERFGTSMADAMRTFAGTMREMRSQRAQEEAETMAVKLIFPMIVFLFPAVVMVTAGPAGLSLAKAVSAAAH